ncbi:hypothetical protein F4859DRAFT_505389 [Xylaria cf. heliscus]|nr:hypothetical protein F4859DRAFT_505389 [Xylaria cf. heliscus]
MSLYFTIGNRNSASTSTMHSLNIDKYRKAGIETNNIMPDNKSNHFHPISLKGLFRSMLSRHPSASSIDHPPVRRPTWSPDASRKNHGRTSAGKPGTQPRSKSAEIPARKTLQGTRGIFVPAYRSPEHFSQQRRRRNPTLPLYANIKQRSQSRSSRVIVRFYNCENLTLGRELLTSPDAKRLVSAAIAFIGECQLSDTPDAFIPKSPNPAYRGLSLNCSHGGYHLHYPDCAGVRPFHGNVSADWDRLMRIYARDFPNSVLFIGVGLGEPGTQCH